SGHISVSRGHSLASLLLRSCDRAARSATLPDADLQRAALFAAYSVAGASARGHSGTPGVNEQVSPAAARRPAAGRARPLGGDRRALARGEWGQPTRGQVA